MDFAPGANTTNTFVSTGDPEVRKFIVYLPTTYQPQLGPYPVVFMLHGSGQSARLIKNRTTWNQAAEVFDFIMVYPEALPYLLLDYTTQTKWATDNTAENVVHPSELPMADDVLYLRELFNTLGAHLNIDCERVYASGFSNGGAFVKSKIRVHLADIFAATTNAAGIGLPISIPSDFYPENGVDFRPHFEVVGNWDDKKLTNCVNAGDLDPGESLPRLLVDIMATPCMWDPLTALAAAVGMNPGAFAGTELPAYTQILWGKAVLPGPGPTEYRFRVLPNLAHSYPSGTNYPVDYVPVFYDWMSQFTK